MFDYFDMLSGDPIYLRGVGRIRSPKISDLYPASGIGQSAYTLYVNLLMWDKDKVLQYDRILGCRGERLLHRDGLLVFDVITLLKETRELCREALSFFMVEDIDWDEKGRRFVTYVCDESGRTVIGEINRNNFDVVKAHMLQMNYVWVDRESDVNMFSDRESRELWDRVQKHLAAQSKKVESAPRPEYRLSNIISKLCAVHPSYNLLNVKSLTIFQLYDAFFQCGYLRSAGLSEQIFSNHGGEKFKFEDWLKPIL